MNSDRLPDLVADALELAPAARAAFLTQACGGDAALLAEALALAGNDAGTFLERPAYALAAGEALGDPGGGDLQPGDTLGECRIISLLGEGGMGEVYLADDTRLERRVALKLLKRHPGDESLARRFRHERRVLAALTHPNIARLYGGSATPEGRSYLVMEYVEGERLDKFCDARGLGVGERLALFRKVCAAVTYAHQNLVVHRDLKPANIRVTPEGEPKLLDFGIAKLLDPEAGAGPLADPTLTLMGAMTPEYASPEQLRGEPITTATDVYSLGVILYELLCGQRPYQLKNRRPDELARAICEQEPPRPSTVAGRGKTHPARPTDAATPLVVESPARRRRRLAGDLDTIVAQAMRKEPARRYAGAAALSEDIRRHGEGLPVLARRDTLPYRAGKFVRRNTAGVAAAALVLLALVGGLVATSIQRDRARLAQAQAERLNGFLQTLLGSADPEKGPGRDLKVVQVLDQASDNLDRELAGEPTLRAQAHLTLGQAYAGLQEADPALNHLRAALEIDRRIYGDNHLATARAQAALGATLVALTRRYDEAEPLLRQSLVVERQSPAAKPRELLRTLKYEALALSQVGQIDQARQTVGESLALIRKTNGEQSTAYADGLVQTASLSISQGNYRDAEAPYRQAVAILRRLGIQTPSYAATLTGFAYDLILLGKLDEPEGLLRESLECLHKTVGDRSTASAFNEGCLGWLYFLRRDYPRAETELRASQTLARDSLVPKGEQDYVGGSVALGLALTRNGKTAEAEPLLRESLGFARANHLVGNAAPDTVSAALGECLLAQGRYAEAEPLLLAGYTPLQANPTDPAIKLLDVKALLHTLYTAWRKPEQAARYAPAP